jgi:lycopene cyclase domain-containing protein
MTYLAINILVFVFPLILSFHKGMQLQKKWWALWPAIFLTSVFFISWDMLFTQWGIWSFNPEHLTGIQFLNLPIEEILFFYTVPFASVFIYEVLKSRNKVYISEKRARFISYFIIFSLIITGLINYKKLYTSITFISTATFLSILIYSHYKKFGLFYASYIIIIIPFLITNGILTGSFIDSEVVRYNSDYILNVRILTIPIEDSIYGLLLIFMTIYLYESILQRYVKKLS